MSTETAKGRTKTKKKKLPLISSEYTIGHKGAKDGVLLQPEEKFAKSWTILNTSPPNSKEKSVVAKIIHCDGQNLKDHLFFLWPVPGKSVDVS